MNVTGLRIIMDNQAFLNLTLSPKDAKALIEEFQEKGGRAETVRVCGGIDANGTNYAFRLADVSLMHTFRPEESGQPAAKRWNGSGF